MSSNWNFSPSSLQYLERCIAAAPPLDVNNKWYLKFGKESSKSTNPALVETAFEPKDRTVCIIENTSPEHINETNHEDFLDVIENDFDVADILEKCAQSPSVVPKMAERLSTTAVDKIFNYIFSNYDDSHITFITTFLHPYIKSHHSRQIIDLLMKLSERPSTFKNLLQVILNDTNVDSQVIHSYVTALNEESVTKFMKILMNISISTQGFLHNISSIHMAYRTCIKTDETQNFVQNLLIEHSQSCTSDTNYGKLFLTFLQAEKGIERSIEEYRRKIKTLEECLRVHNSPFKRPCAVLLEQIMHE